MPWFRLDDSFHSHPKVIAAGNEAIGLYVRCGTHAAEHLTDGSVSKDVALSYGSAALADTLVRTGLWHRARGGWTIHDYLDYNPSREAVEKERKASAERQRRRREAMQSRRDTAVTNGVSTSSPTRTSYRSTDDGARASPRRAAPSSKTKPPWCGICDQETRQTGPADQPYRCPNCHPLNPR